MICKNCGQELNEESVFCNKCGTKIETITETVEVIAENPIQEITESQNIENKTVSNMKSIDKKKIFAIGAVAIVVILIFSSLFGGGEDYQGSNEPVYQEDDFGKKNEVVTQPQTTEAITVAQPNVEVVVNRKKFYNSLNGTAELVDYQTSIMKNTNKVVLEVKIKVISKENDPSDMFTVPCTAYDANGTLLFSNNAWVMGWVTAETGDILRGTFDTMCKNGEVARIEIG